MVRSQSEAAFYRLRCPCYGGSGPRFLITGVPVRGESGRICAVDGRLAVEGLSPCGQRLKFNAINANRRRA